MLLVLLPFALVEMLVPLVQSGELFATVAASRITAPRRPGHARPGTTNRPSRHRCHPVPPCRCTASVSCGPARSRRWSTDWTWTWPKGNGCRSRRTERMPGKSTVAAALRPVHRPRPATADSVGPTPADSEDPVVVRRVVTWCPQSPWLADTSLRANLRIADPEVTESAMWHVLDRVRMSDWAHRAPRRARHHARTRRRHPERRATPAPGAGAGCSWPTTGWWCWTSRQPTWTPTPPRPCSTTCSSHFGGAGPSSCWATVTDRPPPGRLRRAPGRPGSGRLPGADSVPGPAGPRARTVRVRVDTAHPDPAGHHFVEPWSADDEGEVRGHAFQRSAAGQGGRTTASSRCRCRWALSAQLAWRWSAIVKLKRVRSPGRPSRTAPSAPPSSSVV